MEFIGALGPSLALSVLADSSIFLFNSGANFARGTFNVATRATQLGQRIVFRDPNSIEYLQSDIKSTFKNGQSVRNMITALGTEALKPVDVEPIRIFKTSAGRMFTLDHRRLFAFRQAGKGIPTVEVSSTAVADEIARKATGVGGHSIRIRGE